MKRPLFLACLFALACAACPAAAQNPPARIAPRDGAKPVRYSPMIFGQFLEHFDNQVYGGVFDPTSRFADKSGFRTDVAQALREIKCPIVRWPGGCFVSTYHWKDGVGKTREAVYDKAWNVYDPNTFGTDEFVAWCRLVGCEPYICTNAGTGTPEEMSDWVEYCNLPRGKFAKMRAANGHPEPFNVRYWSVGNENYGGWELGAKTVQEWGPLVCESAKLMRAVDHDLKLLAAATSNEKWTGPLLDRAGGHLDYVSIHGYWDPLHHVNNVSPYLACMMRTKSPDQTIVATKGILARHGLGGRVKIAYDEWNLRGWHHPTHGDFRAGFDLAARRKNDIASTYTMADAVFSACFLNACLRHADTVTMACFAPCVNTRGCIFAHKDGIVKRTTWHVFRMYTSLLEPLALPVDVTCGELREGKKSVPVLDAVLTQSEDGARRVLAVANKHPKESVPLALGDWAKGAQTLSATVLSGETADSYNDVEHPERVVPVAATLPVRDGAVALPPHSVIFIKL